MKYEEDCSMIEICEKYDNVFGICEPGESINIRRCSPADKMMIKILVQINEKLEKLIDK